MGLLHKLRHPVRAYKNYVAEEKIIVKVGGADKDKTYYVIRCDLPECGFFAIFMYILDHLIWANDKGYVPVLDIERYSCLYKERQAVNGTRNPWEYYFKSFSQVDLSECKKKHKVIYSAIHYPHYKALYYYRNKAQNVLPNRERIYELNHIVSKYMQFQPEVLKILNEEREKLEKFQRVLGIHVRGTDMYTEGKHHPVPSGKTKDFSMIDSIIEGQSIDGIFLSTDTDSTVEIFRDKYKDMVVVTDATRQKDDRGIGLHKDKRLQGKRTNHKYLLGIEVLKDMYMLANCNVLICGPSNVAFAAIIYNNNNYDKIYYCT